MQLMLYCMIQDLFINYNLVAVRVTNNHSLKITIDGICVFGENYLSTVALIRNAKNRLKVHLFTLFSLDIFRYAGRKSCSIF